MLLRSCAPSYRGARPRLENLEDRCLLAGLFVTESDSTALVDIPAEPVTVMNGEAHVQNLYQEAEAGGGADPPNSEPLDTVRALGDAYAHFRSHKSPYESDSYPTGTSRATVRGSFSFTIGATEAGEEGQPVALNYEAIYSLQTWERMSNVPIPGASGTTRIMIRKTSGPGDFTIDQAEQFDSLPAPGVGFAHTRFQHESGTIAATVGSTLTFEFFISASVTGTVDTTELPGYDKLDLASYLSFKVDLVEAQVLINGSPDDDDDITLFNPAALDQAFAQPITAEVKFNQDFVGHVSLVVDPPDAATISPSQFDNPDPVFPKAVTITPRRVSTSANDVTIRVLFDNQPVGAEDMTIASVVLGKVRAENTPTEMLDRIPPECRPT